MDLLQPGIASEDVFEDFALGQHDAHSPNALAPPPSPSHKHKVHSDHDYFAHRSPGQHSDSGVSLNSLEMDESYVPQVAATDEGGDRTDDFKRQKALDSSPQQSDSMSPFSDTNSDSNPLGLEDFDFSTFMECGDVDSVEGLGLDTIDGSAFSGCKDTDVSIDFGEFGLRLSVVQSVLLLQY